MDLNNAPQESKQDSQAPQESKQDSQAKVPQNDTEDILAMFDDEPTEPSESSSSGSDREAAGASEGEAEVEGGGGDSDAGEETAPPSHGDIPYSRFKEVNDEKNKLRKELEQLKAGTTNDSKDQSSGSADVNFAEDEPAQNQVDDAAQGSTKQAPNEFIKLSQEAKNYLKQTNPELYESYARQELKNELFEELQKKEAIQAKAAIARRKVDAYVQYHTERVFNEFKDIKDPNSEWFKSTAPEMQKLAKEVPAIIQDPGAYRIALQLVELRRTASKMKEALRKEVLAEINSARGAKKQAVMAGQAHAAKPLRATDDDWGGEPTSFSKSKK